MNMPDKPRKLRKYGYTIRGFHTSSWYPGNVYADLRDGEGNLLMSATIERILARVCELIEREEEQEDQL